MIRLLYVELTRDLQQWPSRQDFKTWKSHRNRDVSHLSRSRASGIVISFLIFEFLNLEFGKIDTNIDIVSFVLE